MTATEDLRAYNQLITKTYNDLTFTFRADGYFNMTKAAKAFGKDMQSFMRMDDTGEYISALKSNSVSGTEYVVTKSGRYGGTWAHPKLAIFFARWLDVRFAVWCDAMIEDILKYLVGGLEDTREILPSTPLLRYEDHQLLHQKCLRLTRDVRQGDSPGAPSSPAGSSRGGPVKL